MEIEQIPEKYGEQLKGVLDCYDRIVISGNLFPLCFSQGLTSYFFAQRMRIFDYTKFAEPLRDEIRKTIQSLAQENGLDIEFVTKRPDARKLEFKRFWKHEGIIPVSCIYSRPWKAVERINPGMTKGHIRRISKQPGANVCTTMFTSLTQTWAYAICVCQPGVPFGCSSTAMDIGG